MVQSRWRLDSQVWMVFLSAKCVEKAGESTLTGFWFYNDKKMKKSNSIKRKKYKSFPYELHLLKASSIRELLC